MNDDLSHALSLLDKAMVEVDDIAYAKLVCGAADVADMLEKSSTGESLPIWARIAKLDGDRARMGDLVDHAKVKAQAAGLETLPTTSQEFQIFLESLPPAQRCLMQVRHLQAVVTSERGSPSGIKAAVEALELLAEYEKTNRLTKKQNVMKLVFQDALQRSS